MPRYAVTMTVRLDIEAENVMQAAKTARCVTYVISHTPNQRPLSVAGVYRERHDRDLLTWAAREMKRTVRIRRRRG